MCTNRGITATCSPSHPSSCRSHPEPHRVGDREPLALVHRRAQRPRDRAPVALPQVRTAQRRDRRRRRAPLRDARAQPRRGAVGRQARVEAARQRVRARDGVLHGRDVEAEQLRAEPALGRLAPLAQAAPQRRPEADVGGRVVQRAPRGRRAAALRREARHARGGLLLRLDARLQPRRRRCGRGRVGGLRQQVRRARVGARVGRRRQQRRLGVAQLAPEALRAALARGVGRPHGVLQREQLGVERRRRCCGGGAIAVVVAGRRAGRRRRGAKLGHDVVVGGDLFLFGEGEVCAPLRTVA